MELSADYNKGMEPGIEMNAGFDKEMEPEMELSAGFDKGMGAETEMSVNDDKGMEPGIKLSAGFDKEIETETSINDDKGMGAETETSVNYDKEIKETGTSVNYNKETESGTGKSVFFQRDTADNEIRGRKHTESGNGTNANKKKVTRQEKRERQMMEIQRLMDENGGVVKTSQLYTLGMDYRRIQTFVDYGVIERVKNGYYSMNFHKKREEDIIATMFPDCVLSMESALYCHHYLKNRPFKWTVAVDKNTSKSRFKMDYPLVQPYYTEPEVLQMGVVKMEFGSSEMSVYCKERLICDVLKYENRMNREDLQQALRAFLMDKNKDIAKLLAYAKERKVLSKVRNQIGVWL